MAVVKWGREEEWMMNVYITAILQSENEPPAKLNLPFSKSPHIWLSGDGFDDPCF